MTGLPALTCDRLPRPERGRGGRTTLPRRPEEDSIENGVPRAMLVPLPATKATRKPARALRVTYLAPDFDAPDPSIATLFEGDVSEE